MICNKCGIEMLDHFDALKFEHVYKCPNCDYSNISNSRDAAFPPNFRSMNSIDFAKYATEQQMYIRPEDCIEEVKFDYNPFKELRQEFEQNLLTYRNDKDALIDILSSTVKLLLGILEVTHAYRG